MDKETTFRVTGNEWKAYCDMYGETPFEDFVKIVYHRTIKTMPKAWYKLVLVEMGGHWADYRIEKQ